MNNQNDVMDFPETFEEFALFYAFRDNEKIYTNGSDLIPVFRVKQWLEHANRWIPVSEGTPKDREWYLGIFKEPDTGWVNPLPYICVYMGHETRATTKEHWILKGYTDRDEDIDYYFNLECVAWMPFEPYKEESDDENLVDRIDAEIAKRLEVHKGGNMREIYIVSTTDNQWYRAVLLTEEQAKAIEWFIKESHIDYHIVKVSNIIEEVE